MKTQQLITLEENKLAPLIKDMKVKELEKHAQKLLGMLGAKEFDAMMLAVIKQVQVQASDNQQRFEQMRDLVKAHLPSGDYHEDILNRLTVILTVLVTKKFHAIHNE